MPINIYDQVLNLATSLVASAPSPAISGTSLQVTAGEGAYFPSLTSFDVTVHPADQWPSHSNAEIMRVTRVGDTFTLTRAQGGTSAKPIAVGWRISQTVNAESHTDIQRHNWIDVTDPIYGAKGDAINDDSNALDAAWAAVKALPAFGGVLYIPDGFYKVTREIDWTDGIGITVIGSLGSQIFAPAGASFGATNGIIKFTGTRYSCIFGLRISGQVTGANRPGAGLILGRTAEDGSYNHYYNLWIEGEFGVAGCYDAGSEVIDFYHCAFGNNLDTGYTYYTTSNDSVIGLANSGSSLSNTAKQFNGCRFVHDYAGANTVHSIGMASLCVEYYFINCFFTIVNTGIGRFIHLLDSVGADASSSLKRLVIIGNRAEQNNSTSVDTRFIYNNKNLGAIEIRILNFGWTPATAAYFIEDLRGISDSEFDWRPVGSQKLVNITSPAQFRQNRITGRLNLSVNVNAGGGATENIFNMMDTGFPLQGAGQLGDSVGRQDNIILCAGAADAYASIPVIRQRMGVFTNGDTTPSVQGLSLWETANSGATSISELDDGETGQRVTILVKDANTTFVHTVANTVDTLKLAGSVNWAAPNGSNITFQRDERATNIWREVARTIP